MRLWCLLFGILITGAHSPLSAQNAGVALGSTANVYTYEFSAVYQLGGKWHFLLTHRTDTRSFWLTPQNPAYGCSVVDFNPDRGLLTIEYSGRKEILALKKTGEWKPMEVAGQILPGDRAEQSETVSASTGTTPNNVQLPSRRSAISKNPALRANNLQFKRDRVRQQQAESQRSVNSTNATQSIPNAPGNRLPESAANTNDTSEKSARPDFQKYKEMLKRGEAPPVNIPVLKEGPPATE
ncbi:MAG: hypothetical protein SFY80_09155 [Verrucomicrobiota bacterium]|nr:hypothetical protein [Verrucomicrobiota bacterium]